MATKLKFCNISYLLFSFFFFLSTVKLICDVRAVAKYPADIPLIPIDIDQNCHWMMFVSSSALILPVVLLRNTAKRPVTIWLWQCISSKVRDCFQDKKSPSLHRFQGISYYCSRLDLPVSCGPADVVDLIPISARGHDLTYWWPIWLLPADRSSKFVTLLCSMQDWRTVMARWHRLLKF